MDSRQFDRWTRLFDGTSRRDAITVLATGISSGLLAGGGSRGVLAQVSGEKCKDKGDNCNNNNDCCNNLKCKNGTCKKDNNNDNNDCKGKGGCAVPLMEGAWTQVRASLEEKMKAEKKEIGPAPPKKKKS